MSMRLLIVVMLGLSVTSAAQAIGRQQVQKDTTSELIDSLFNKEIVIEGNVNDMSLLEVLNQISKREGITFSINLECFKQAMMPDVQEKKPQVAATTLQRMNLHQFLVQVLEGLGATYIVKGNGVEIVTVAHAAKVAQATIEVDAEGNKSLKEPLVCAIIKQKPLFESIDQLASRYDLSITISPQAVEGRASLVSARILNLPADKAVEMLALQCDLRVVRKGNAFVITSRDHAKTLLADQAEQERSKIELERLRAGLPSLKVPPPQKTELKSIPGTSSGPVSPNR